MLKWWKEELLYNAYAFYAEKKIDYTKLLPPFIVTIKATIAFHGYMCAE